MDYSVKIGGEAGQGIQTIGDTLAKVFSRAGFHVFTHQDYESRVRGGHNFFQIRFSDKPVTASRDKIDILVAFDKESIVFHEKELSGNGQIIYDASALPPLTSPLDKSERPFAETRFGGGLRGVGENERLLDIPFTKLAVEHSGNKLMANTVAIGAVLGMLSMEPDILFGIIRDTFKKKGEDVINSNINAVMTGHDYAVTKCLKCSFLAAPLSKSKMLISGIEAIGFGAVASGCKFYSAYPMTPSTGIMNYLAEKGKDYGIVVEQAEDEIAAINMALGASFAGVRSMTGTSGGGFALMTEGLSLAGMTETPVVIALGQRPGPATGLPTRTEQADLQFALYTAHGECPRAIFAPGTPEQAFYLTNKAFDIAEKYQIPAFILFDQYLADSQWTYEGFDLNRIKYTDYRLRGDAFKNLSGYKRHAFTETGISPFGIPGDAGHVVVTDSDEHDEEGHIIEDAETRIKMVQKRLFKKLESIRREMEPPVFYGHDNPEIVIVGWGSTYGVMKEVVDACLENPPIPPTPLCPPPKRVSAKGRSDLSRGEFKGGKIAMLHFSEIYPFPSSVSCHSRESGNPEGIDSCRSLPSNVVIGGRNDKIGADRFDYLSILNNARLAVCVENNAGGQFARLMRSETGYEFKNKINRYDGRPFLLDELVRELNAFIG